MAAFGPTFALFRPGSVEHRPTSGDAEPILATCCSKVFEFGPNFGDTDQQMADSGPNSPIAVDIVPSLGITAPNSAKCGRRLPRLNPTRPRPNVSGFDRVWPDLGGDRPRVHAPIAMPRVPAWVAYLEHMPRARAEFDPPSSSDHVDLHNRGVQRGGGGRFLHCAGLLDRRPRLSRSPPGADF